MTPGFDGILSSWDTNRQTDNFLIGKSTNQRLNLPRTQMSRPKILR